MKLSEKRHLMVSTALLVLINSSLVSKVESCAHHTESSSSSSSSTNVKSTFPIESRIKFKQAPSLFISRGGSLAADGVDGATNIAISSTGNRDHNREEVQEITEPIMSLVQVVGDNHHRLEKRSHSMKRNGRRVRRLTSQDQMIVADKQEAINQLLQELPLLGIGLSSLDAISRQQQQQLQQQQQQQPLQQQPLRSRPSLSAGGRLKSRSQLINGSPVGWYQISPNTPTMDVAGHPKRTNHHVPCFFNAISCF